MTAKYTKPVRFADMDRAVLAQIVAEVYDALFWTGEGYDPDKECGADEIEAVARAFHRHGLAPKPDVAPAVYNALHHGFVCGEYASIYVSDDLDVSWHEEKEDNPSDPAAYRAAFVIGFFSMYETNDVPDEHRDELIAATGTYREAMRAIGIAVDPRP